VKAEEGQKDKNEFSLYINPDTQAALVSMDTNGHVLAMAGGFDFSISQFNRATQALRQPGSAFKPIVYSAALDKGYSETSILYDMPVVIKDWAPQNYDGEYKGAIILRQAIAKSRNLATIRLMLDIQPSYVVDYSKNFGFTSKLNPYPSLALGGTDLKMLEMVKAYNVFATGGKLVEPQFILRIYDRNGRIIEDNTGGTFISQEENLKAERERKRLDILKEIAREKGRGVDSDLELLKEDILIDTTDFFGDSGYTFLTPNEFLDLIKEGPVDFSSSEMAQQTLNPETAYIMTDLLEAVVTEGTGRRAQNLNNLAPVAGKTGTTNDYTDAWFVGFSPRLTTAVWVGRDDHKSLGKKEAGSSAALPIWIDYMEQALTEYPGGSFSRPSSIQVVSTPYGNIPYSVDSLRQNVLDSIRNSVMIDGREGEIPYDYNQGDYGQNASDSETNIDFILNR
jgi:penicillin-binding protein 1A